MIIQQSRKIWNHYDIINEIVHSTMKSEHARMKSSIFDFRWNQIHPSAPSGFHPTNVGFHRETISPTRKGGFNWKTSLECSSEVFLGDPYGNRGAERCEAEPNHIFGLSRYVEYKKAKANRRKKKKASTLLMLFFFRLIDEPSWWPIRESNPCYRRERAMS